jgi:ribosomal protein L44E
MTENNAFRKILPTKTGTNGFKKSQSGVAASKRSKVSLACTECQKKKTKVRNNIRILVLELMYLM